MLARPARVRIRSRKPWVLDRRRLFGWNVRLLTRYSHYTTSAVRPRPETGTRGVPAGTAGAAPRDPRKLVAVDNGITRPARARDERGQAGQAVAAHRLRSA